jgi:hypothetical protein
MTRDRVARILAIGILAAAGAFGIVGKMGLRIPRMRPAEGGTAQDAIYGMLEAAHSGDIKSYLSCYTGQMLADLNRAVAEKTAAGFQRYLQSQNREIKGVALGAPEPVADREVEIRVEYIYQDRNEAQTIYLQKEETGWKIARVDSAERVKTLVPFGTPVR